MTDLYVYTSPERLDPNTLEPLRPSWRLPESRPSRYLRLGDSAPTTASRTRATQPPGEWVERSSTHPTSGRKILWRERTIATGTIERHYLNPILAER
jgi:hypothetical protein